MKDKIPLTVDIPLPVDVVTGETCSRIVQQVIEVLLYQRNQIPFCYDTFRTIVEKFDKKETDEKRDWKDYQLTKQRDAAIDALSRIKHLFKELPNVTSRSSTVMILFGSTVYTAKEAFQVNLPSVNLDHHPDIHRPGLETALKQLAMALILSEDLQTGSERITGPTKMFLLLKRTETELDLCPGWQRMEEFRLPASCRRHVITLVQKKNDDQQQLTCCKEMVIFSEEDNGLERAEVATDIKEEQAEEGIEVLESVWYQVGEGLKGYKDAEVKGKLIWNCES